MIVPDPVLSAAYTSATYRIAIQPHACTVRIGLRHPGLDRRLRTRGCQSHWHLLTACNPRSQVLPAAENERLQRALLDAVSRCGWRHLPACGQSDDGSWAEPGWCLLDAEPRTASAMGQGFGQAALVIGRLDQRAELIWLPPDSVP